MIFTRKAIERKVLSVADHDKLEAVLLKTFGSLPIILTKHDLQKLTEVRNDADNHVDGNGLVYDEIMRQIEEHGALEVSSDSRKKRTAFHRSCTKPIWQPGEEE